MPLRAASFGMAVCAFSTGANSQPKGATLKWLGIMIAAAVLISGCGGDAPPEAESAQDHPDWSAAVGVCDQAVLDARDDYEYGSAQWILGYEEMHEARRGFCEAMTQCLWDETGNVIVEFTVASKRAFEDCTRLVLSVFD